MDLLQHQIKQNNIQLKYLANKIYKTDYQINLQKKLKEKEAELAKKKAEMLEMNKLQSYAKYEQQRHKKMQNQTKMSLASQYLQQMNQRRNRQKLQKQREKQQERMAIQRSQYLNDQQRRLHAQQRNVLRQSFINQYQLKQQQKRKQKQLQSQEKEHYRNQIQYIKDLDNLKELNYKQYYRQFQQNNRLNRIPDIRSSEKEDMIKKTAGIDNLMFRNHDYTLTKRKFDQDQMKAVLQHQLRQKEQKAYSQKLNHFKSAEQTVRNQAFLSQIEQHEKDRKRQDQKRYDQQLNKQINMRRQSHDTLSTRVGIHNPITNPISFKIDPMNKYIVGQYSLAKQREIGQARLKLGNLTHMSGKPITPIL